MFDKINLAKTQKSTAISASKPLIIFFREVSSNVVVKILNELIGNNNFHIVPPLKSRKGLQVIIKSIDFSVESRGIKEGLEELGYNIKNVNGIRT